MKSGYYTDAGRAIDPDSIKLPTLCKKCAKNGRPEEEIPCNLNRIDQRKEIGRGQKFICDAYQTYEK